MRGLYNLYTECKGCNHATEHVNETSANMAALSRNVTLAARKHLLKQVNSASAFLIILFVACHLKYTDFEAE